MFRVRMFWWICFADRPTTMSWPFWREWQFERHHGSTSCRVPSPSSCVCVYGDGGPFEIVPRGSSIHDVMEVNYPLWLVGTTHTSKHIRRILLRDSWLWIVVRGLLLPVMHAGTCLNGSLSACLCASVWRSLYSIVHPKLWEEIYASVIVSQPAS